MVPMRIPLRLGLLLLQLNIALFSHHLVYLALLALDDGQLALQIVLQSLAVLPQLVVFLFDLHGQLNLLIRVAMANLEHLILVLEALHLNVQLFVLRREHFETSDSFVHISLALLQLLVQVRLVVIVSLDGASLLLVVRLHEVYDLLHLTEL